MSWFGLSRSLSRSRRRLCCHRTVIIKCLLGCVAGLFVITVLILPEYGNNESGLLEIDTGKGRLHKLAEENSNYELDSADYHSTSVGGDGDHPKMDDDVRNTPRFHDVIIYNRVPKCGSTSTRMLLDQVSRSNRFNIYVSKIYAQESLNMTGQEVFTDYIVKLKRPLLFIRHVFFVDFTEFAKHQPLYINMIRDPLDRLVSDYYFKRYNLQHMFPMDAAKRDLNYNDCVQGNYSECVQDGPKGYFRIIPYFCGQDARCLIPSQWALDRAKHNVEKYFLVVGVVEDMSKFLDVLEILLPEYFKGSADIYQSGGEKWRTMGKTKKKDPLQERTINIMKQKLVYDYDFYKYIENRFKKQYEDFFGYRIIR